MVKTPKVHDRGTYMSQSIYFKKKITDCPQEMPVKYGSESTIQTWKSHFAGGRASLSANRKPRHKAQFRCLFGHIAHFVIKLFACLLLSVRNSLCIKDTNPIRSLKQPNLQQQKVQGYLIGKGEREVCVGGGGAVV